MSADVDNGSYSRISGAKTKVFIKNFVHITVRKIGNGHLLLVIRNSTFHHWTSFEMHIHVKHDLCYNNILSTLGI